MYIVKSEYILSKIWASFFQYTSDLSPTHPVLKTLRWFPITLE